MNKKAVFSVAILLLSGCTMQGEITDNSKNKQMVCIDTRDGETFTFNTNTITDVKIGIAGAPTSFTIINNEGIQCTINTNME